MHTDVVNVVVRWAVRTQSSTRSSCDQRAGADAAGEDDDVGRRQLLERGVDLDAEEAVVGPHDLAGAWPTNVTSKPGMRCSTSYGPDAVEGGEAVEEGDGDRWVGMVHEAWSFRWWLKRRR